MDTKDIIKATQSTQRLIQDPDYYKYIFKKTERIVSVIFYITHTVKNEGHNEGHVADIEAAARQVHDVVLNSLQERAHVAEDAIRASAHALVTLESKAKVAQVSGVITQDVLQVVSGEIDAVLRGMNKYVNDESVALQTDEVPQATPVKRTSQSSEVTNQVTPNLPSGTDKNTRRARILTVIEAKGEATIKDISEVINDVSEKTIQRELTAMIEDNIVKRQGERRWSKYSTFK